MKLVSKLKDQPQQPSTACARTESTYLISAAAANELDSFCYHNGILKSEFLEIAIREAIQKRSGKQPQQLALTISEVAPQKPRKRKRITPEIKLQVLAMLRKNKTGREIAEELGISTGAVSRINTQYTE